MTRKRIKLGEATHAYAGIKKCGKAEFLQVDEGRAPKASDIRACLEAGGTVKRITLEEARATPLCFGCEGCA